MLYRELILTPDDGEICLDWVDDQDMDQTKYTKENWPTVILMPGISGRLIIG